MGPRSRIAENRPSAHDLGLATPEEGRIFLRTDELGLERHPKDCQTYIVRGNAYQDKGELGLAVSDYDKASEIDPEYAVPYNYKAQCYEKLGRTSEALEAYRGFVRRSDPAAPGVSRALQRTRDLEERLKDTGGK